MNMLRIITSIKNLSTTIVVFILHKFQEIFNVIVLLFITL